MENKSIKNQIMNKIEQDEIKMTSRWVCIAQKLGLKSSMAFTILVLVFLVNAFLYYIKSNELLLSLHYSDTIWQKLLHSLPYDLILIIIIFGIFLHFLSQKFDFWCKKSFMFICTSFMGIIIVLAALLFVSHFNYYLRNGLQKSHRDVPFLTNFYVHRCCLDGACENNN